MYILHPGIHYANRPFPVYVLLPPGPHDSDTINQIRAEAKEEYPESTMVVFLAER